MTDLDDYDGYPEELLKEMDDATLEKWRARIERQIDRLGSEKGKIEDILEDRE